MRVPLNSTAVMPKTSDQAAHYWLRATELMLLARGYAQATDDLAAITEDQLKPLAITRKRIAEAELALYAEDYIGIIQALAEQDSKNNLKAPNCVTQSY